MRPSHPGRTTGEPTVRRNCLCVARGTTWTGRACFRHRPAKRNHFNLDPDGACRLPRLSESREVGCLTAKFTEPRSTALRDAHCDSHPRDHVYPLKSQCPGPQRSLDNMEGRLHLRAELLRPDGEPTLNPKRTSTLRTEADSEHSIPLNRSPKSSKRC